MVTPSPFAPLEFLTGFIPLPFTKGEGGRIVSEGLHLFNLLLINQPYGEGLYFLYLVVEWCGQRKTKYVTGVSSIMDFNQLSWGTVCFYYRSAGDNKYSKIMKDTAFLSKLREAPFDISPAEFEEKVLLDHVNIENYDLLIGHNLAQSVLSKIVELHPEVSSLQNVTLLDCELSDSAMTEKLNKVYADLYSIQGLWLTGVSKIAHLLNDKLFAILNLNISNHFGILEGNTNLIHWLRITQQNAEEVTRDFQEQGLSGSPEKYLSGKLGYTSLGYEKPLVKFIDEYFWLCFGDNLPVPPRWVPSYIEES